MGSTKLGERSIPGRYDAAASSIRLSGSLAKATGNSAVRWNEGSKNGPGKELSRFGSGRTTPEVSISVVGSTLNHTADLPLVTHGE